MRSILIQRGHDPREFVVMAFGGSGGLHAASVMRELNVDHTIVPSNPGALSALGMLGTDFRQDRARTLVRAVDDLDRLEIGRAYSELVEEAVSAVVADGVGGHAVTAVRSIDLRYVGQEYHLNLPLDEDDSAFARGHLTERFHEMHRHVYGYAAPEFRVEIVGLRVAAFGRTPAVQFPRIGPRRAGDVGPSCTLRAVYVPQSGWDEIPIYSVDDVCAGDLLRGPCILEDPRSTMLILPDQHGRIDEFRNLHIVEEAS
jgi:N-methylhydantoinase A